MDQQDYRVHTQIFSSIITKLKNRNWKKVTSAVREAKTSRPNGGSIGGPLKPTNTSAVMCKGRGGDQLDPHDADAETI